MVQPRRNWVRASSYTPTVRYGHPSSSKASRSVGYPGTLGEKKGSPSPPHHKAKASKKPRIKTEDDDRSIDSQSQDKRLANKKFRQWQPHATSSPFPDFKRPTTPQGCHIAYDLLNKMHGEAVDAEFRDSNTPETIPDVFDAMTVALLSAATSWSNAKRAMDSMKDTYGSVFAYDDIVAGGRDKLQDSIRCGGLHVHESGLIFQVLQQVQDRHGANKWNLNHLFNATDEDAMKELMSYKGVGPKCALVVMNWCLKRGGFIVDTHVYRLAGLWHWAPTKATRETTQAHLNARIPEELKFRLHFLMLQRGRPCSICRGGSKTDVRCNIVQQLEE